MRFSTSTSFRALGIILFSGLLFTGCGSFQNASYYSDGIYSDDNVIVIRKTKKTSTANAYSQYFDQQAKQYSWDDSNNDVALTNLDSLNQGNLTNYQTNPNWGGGNKTTQIVIQSSPLYLGNYGNWGFGGFYDPYFAYWDYNYYNPYRWNRFAWGFNRPFFGGYYPYYRPGFFYGDPYFYGGGFWNGYGYAYNRAFNRHYYRANHNNRSNFRNHRAYSSSYRGQATSGRRTSVSTAAVQQNSANVSGSRSTANSPRPSNQVTEVPNLVRRGRTATTRQNNNTTENRGRASQRNAENSNRSQIERVIRSMQNNGFDIQVINSAQQARRYAAQNRLGNGLNSGNRSATSPSRSNTTSSPKKYTTGRNYSKPSSSRNSNAQSSPSRSYSPPARVSTSGGRSSSSGRSSGGRSSSGGRRQ